MLFVVATPIGNDRDISYRAVDLLRSADMVIGEERKEVTKLLKKWEATGRPIELLNEHSDKEDLKYLLEKCQELETVVLVSDCGTPGFCDPGALLVEACRKAQVVVKPVPGPSSLMSLLAVCGHRLDRFLFRGFLPANRKLRSDACESLQSETLPIVIMDTPYRLSRTLGDLTEYFSEHQIILGLRLTQEDELVLEGKPKEIQAKVGDEKAEFILAILPKDSGQQRVKKTVRAKRNNRPQPNSRRFERKESGRSSKSRRKKSKG